MRELNCVGSTLAKNQRLGFNRCLESPNGEYRLYFDDAGVLSLGKKTDDKPLWQANYGRGVSRPGDMVVYVADDGNLCVDDNFQVYWSSHKNLVLPHYRAADGSRVLDWFLNSHWKRRASKPETEPSISMGPDGLTVGTEGRPWYGVTEKAGKLPQRGDVRPFFVTSYKLYNTHAEGYMFACDDMTADSHGRSSGDYIPIGIEVGGGADFHTNRWTLISFERDLYYVYNNHFNCFVIPSPDRFKTGLFASEDSNRRPIMLNPASANAGHDLSCYGTEFEILNPGGTSLIRCVAYDEYIYAASYEAWYKGKRRRLFSWGPQEVFSEAHWQFKEIP